MSTEFEKKTYKVPTLDELRAGGAEAFGDLYKALHPELTRYGEQFIQDNGEDVVNDVFENLLHKLPTLELKEGGSLRGYIFTAVKNRALSQLRPKRNSEVGLTVFGDVAHDVDVAETAVNNVFVGFVLKEVRKLPSRQSEIVLLTAAGYNQQETATMMGIATGSVKSQLSRARVILKNDSKFSH